MHKETSRLRRKMMGTDEVLGKLLEMGFIKINLQNVAPKAFTGIDTFINRDGVVIFGLKKNNHYALMEAYLNAREVRSKEVIPLRLSSIELDLFDVEPFTRVLKSFIENATCIMPWLERPTGAYKDFDPLLDIICEKMANADQEFFKEDAAKKL